MYYTINSKLCSSDNHLKDFYSTIAENFRKVKVRFQQINQKLKMFLVFTSFNAQFFNKCHHKSQSFNAFYINSCFSFSQSTLRLMNYLNWSIYLNYASNWSDFIQFFVMHDTLCHCCFRMSSLILDWSLNWWTVHHLAKSFYVTRHSVYAK